METEWRHCHPVYCVVAPSPESASHVGSCFRSYRVLANIPIRTKRTPVWFSISSRDKN